MIRQRKRKHKVWKFFRANTTEVIVVFAFSICLTFTVTIIYLETKGVSVDSTLIEWVFKFFGLELLALSGIKISKHVGSAFGRAEEKVDGTESYKEE